nr:ribonuclease H-like domain-containing protein [Actinomycetota bacterium]
ALDLPQADVEIDVDCEFDSEGRVYLWGAFVTAPNQADPTYHAFGSADVDLDERAIASDFHSWLADQLTSAEGHSARWYYYGAVEALHLRRILGHVVEPVLAQATDLLNEVIRPNFYAPGGYGLKQLAPAVGAVWRTEGARGDDTLKWIVDARDGDQTAWSQLVDYNEDDTQACRLLRIAVAKSTTGWTLTAEPPPASVNRSDEVRDL